MSVKIVSGFSSTGGSTLYFIALTNLLNSHGIDCTFYGPHEWHLNKCKSGYIGEPPRPRTPLAIYPTDIVISHFIDLKLGPVKAKKHILSCHETNMFELKTKDLDQYDLIQYVSSAQEEWQGVNHPSVIVPPIVDKIEWGPANTRTAGVIGSIDSHKRTHLSISRALQDGYDRVLLYGNIGEDKYFKTKIAPLAGTGRIVFMGAVDNKKEMYSSLDAVYHDSKRETFGLVEAECAISGIPFKGPKNNPEIISEEEFLHRWKHLLEVV